MTATMTNRHWRADEDERLSDLLGRMPPAMIARRLGRTEGAVRARMNRLGLAQRTAHYTAHAMADALGTSHTVVCYWIRTGELRPLPYRSRWVGLLCHHIPHEEIERFIAVRILMPRPKQRWRWQQMPEGWFRHYAANVAKGTSE